MKKLTVNAIFSAFNEGLKDSEIRKQFNIGHLELEAYKILKKQKPIYNPEKLTDKENVGVLFGHKDESYYTEEELINCTHRWMLKENKLFK